MNIARLKTTALSLLIGLSFSCCGQTTVRDKKVDLKEIIQKENTVIVDVRTAEEFCAGHIEQSINIPLSGLPYSIEKLSTFDNIILVCQSGSRSGRAKMLLEEKGLKNVYNGGGWWALNERLKNE